MAALPGTIDQIGIVVPDLNLALEYWIDFMGIGPFFVVPRFDVQGVDYRGSRRDIALGMAFAYSGNLQIELVLPLDDTPSVFTEVPVSNAHTIHHFGILVEDFDSALQSAQQGRTLAQYGQTDVTRHAFLQNAHENSGIRLELLDSTPRMRALCEQVRLSAQGWDGRDPIRSL